MTTLAEIRTFFETNQDELAARVAADMGPDQAQAFKVELAAQRRNWQQNLPEAALVTVTLSQMKSFPPVWEAMEKAGLTTPTGPPAVDPHSGPAPAAETASPMPLSTDTPAAANSLAEQPAETVSGSSAPLNDHASTPTTTTTGGQVMATSSTDDQSNKQASGWTPDRIVQAGKELVTAVIGLLLVFYTLIIARTTLQYVANPEQMSQAKDILLLMTGLSGVVLGYYFGRVPADARATESQQQTDVANAHSAEVSVKAQAVADQVERVLGATTPATTRGESPRDAAAGGVDELQRLRGELRALSDLAGRRP